MHKTSLKKEEGKGREYCTRSSRKTIAAQTVLNLMSQPLKRFFLSTQIRLEMFGSVPFGKKKKKKTNKCP